MKKMSVECSDEVSKLITKMGHVITIPYSCSLSNIQEKLSILLPRKTIKYNVCESNGIQWYSFFYKELDDYYLEHEIDCGRYMVDVCQGRLVEIFHDDDVDAQFRSIMRYCDEYDERIELNKRVKKLEAIIEHLVERSSDMAELSKIVTEANIKIVQTPAITNSTSNPTENTRVTDCL